MKWKLRKIALRCAAGIRRMRQLQPAATSCNRAISALFSASAATSHAFSANMLWLGPFQMLAATGKGTQERHAARHALARLACVFHRHWSFESAFGCTRRLACYCRRRGGCNCWLSRGTVRCPRNMAGQSKVDLHRRGVDRVPSPQGQNKRAERDKEPDEQGGGCGVGIALTSK